MTKLYPVIQSLPNNSVGVEPGRKGIHGVIYQQADGTLLECFDYHLFPGGGSVKWRPTNKYGPPEKVKLNDPMSRRVKTVMDRRGPK